LLHLPGDDFEVSLDNFINVVVGIAGMPTTTSQPFSCATETLITNPSGAVAAEGLDKQKSQIS
jgi:hypothetical protein